MEVVRFRCEIQSPSATGRRTGLEATWLMLFWPVEEVRGGMALGERGLSVDMVERLALVERVLRDICGLRLVLGSVGKNLCPQG